MVVMQGKRLGLYGPGWKRQPLSAAMQQLYNAAQDQLRQLGAELVPDPFVGTDFTALRKPNVFYDDTGALPACATVPLRVSDSAVPHAA